MKAILQGWTVMRVLRLGLSIAILIQGIAAKDTITIVLGTLFGGMALANIGCCGVNGCAVNNRLMNKTQSITHEKLDNKK